MFLNARQLKQLTGIPGSDPIGQMRNLEQRGIRHLGINAAGRVTVPCSAIEGINYQREQKASWTPDFSKVGA